MKKDKFNILYLDDEEHNQNSFKATFRREYKIFTATTAREAIKILRENEIHLIITDQRMPEMTGVQFLEAIIPEFPDAVRIIVTGYSDIEAIIKAINTGRVYRYITKPWDENELRVSMKSAIDLYTIQKKNRELMESLQEKVEEQERILRLFQKYVPKNVVAEALNLQEDDSILQGETRVISALFSDIRNFTELASNLEPTEVVSFLNDYFTVMNHCVKKNKGTVNKFIGDGLLAFFGAPISYLENQYNAVTCALDMKTCLDGINEKYSEKLGIEIKIGIGIHTGEVVVGNIGSEDRMEYTAVGDTVNVSSRIESLTKHSPNCILITESTYKAVQDTIEVNEWEPISIKGKEGKIKVYEVLSRKTIEKS